MSPRWLPLIVAVLALASLTAAVTLTLAASAADAREAWTAFVGLIAYFAGVHTPPPLPP